MDIKLDEDRLEGAINEKIMEAVEKALGGYNVQEAIGDTVKNQIAYGVVNESVERAIGSLNIEGLTKSLAVEIEKATAAAVVTILMEGVVDIVCKIRGLKDFEKDYQQKRDKIRAELKGQK